MRLPIRLKGKIPKTISIHETKGLTACDIGSENCVSSLNKDPGCHIEALPMTSTSSSEEVQRLKAIVLKLSRTHLTKEVGNYLWFECESEFFGFVDDLEFQLLPEKKIIQVRSSSRLGRKDFGVNRKRVERIRGQWLADHGG